MKTITLRIEDELYNDLKRLVSHKGEQSFLLRRALKTLVDSLKEVKNENRTSSRTQNR